MGIKKTVSIDMRYLEVEEDQQGKKSQERHRFEREIA
jgi:hypothetical protein